MDMATELTLRLDPSGIMEMLGLQPDPWQQTLMRSQAGRVLLLCSRQLGKSTAVACVALLESYLNDEALVLIASKTERQAGELFQKIAKFHKRLVLVPTVRDMALTLELANGSRIIALCGEGDNFRGFSAPRLCVVDEASIVGESVLDALLPMLTVSNGRLIALTTPKGKRGWFYEKWIDERVTWERISAKASETPRISKEFLADYLSANGERKYSGEYENVFIEAEGQLFSDETIAAIFDHEGFDGALPPLRGI